MIDDIVIPDDTAAMPLWGRKQVARLVQYHPNHVGWLEKNGKFPPSFTIGGKRVWRPAVVTAFIREAMAKAETKTAA